MLPLVLVLMKFKYVTMSLTEKQTLDIHTQEAFTDPKNIYLKVPGNKALLTQISHYIKLKITNMFHTILNC